MDGARAGAESCVSSKTQGLKPRPQWTRNAALKRRSSTVTAALESCRAQVSFVNGWSTSGGGKLREFKNAGAKAPSSMDPKRGAEAPLFHGDGGFGIVSCPNFIREWMEHERERKAA